MSNKISLPYSPDSEFLKKSYNDRRVYASTDLPEEWRVALAQTTGVPEAEGLDELDGTF
jgi:hypothetical protein